MKMFFLAFAVFSLFGSAVRAAPVTLTGAALFNNPAVSFPGQTPAVLGNSLRYEFPANASILFSIDLDSFVENPAHLLFSARLARLTNDHDPSFYLTDGVNAIGVGLADIAPSGFTDRTRFTAISSQISGNTAPASGLVTLVNDVQIGFPVSSFSFDATINAQRLQTVISATAGGRSGSHTTNAVLDIDRPLSLIFVAAIINASQNEIYQINSLTLDSIPAPVSEPGTVGLLFVALAGLFKFRRLSRFGQSL